MAHPRALDPMDKILKRPHFVAVNPYDPEKHVWVVDDHMHAIYKFTHDGKQLVQTIAPPTVEGATARISPADLSRLASRQHMFVADGYNGTPPSRNSTGRKIPDGLGQKGTSPMKKRPLLYEQCARHRGRSGDARVFVNDRGNTSRAGVR